MNHRRLKRFKNRIKIQRSPMPRPEDMPARGGFRSCSKTRIVMGCCVCLGGQRSHNWACGGRDRRRIKRSGTRCRRSSRIGYRHAF